MWNENVWPGHETPRSNYLRASDCYNAIKERCIFLNVTQPSAPTQRANRADLVAYKSKVKAIIPSFLNKYEFSSGTLQSYFATNSELPYYSVANLCAALKMPTNYFDYTPYRDLSQLGSFTDDASVGHPHGYTNASTAAGGSNLPDGRTTWYTTDYGWDNLKLFIQSLAPVVGTPVTRGAFSQYRGARSRLTWSDATSEADSAYRLFINDVYGYGSQGDYGAPSYYAYKYGVLWTFSSAQSPAKNREFQVYVMTTIIGSAGVSEYNNYGFGYEGGFRNGIFSLAVKATGSTSTISGSLDMTARPPDWCAEPQGPALRYWSKGFKMPALSSNNYLGVLIYDEDTFDYN